MKKTLLTTIALAVSLLAFEACSSDDELQSVILADEITITLRNNRVGVGQFITAYTDVKSSKDGLSYMWKDQYGFSSTRDTLTWLPSKSGRQTISLTLSRKGTSKTLTKEVNVEECDFRLCFWGETMAQVIPYEMAHAAYYQQRINKPILTGLPTKIIFEDIENKCLYSYILDDKLRVMGGVEIYSIKHDVDMRNIEGYNIYLQDYEQHKNQLIEKYGQPITDKTNYKYDFTDRNPKRLGYNVVFGSCTLETTFSHKNNNIILQMKNGSKYETATINVLYKQK